MSLLKVNQIDVSYGDVKVLHQVTVEVGEKEIITIVGANGAGKSTLLKSIAGIIRLTSGEIWFSGEDLFHSSTHQIVDKGLVRIPEGRKVYPTLISILKALAFIIFLLL